MSDTPRTDTEEIEQYSRRNTILSLGGFARTLERELAEANAKLSKLSRMIDIAVQANDAASEAEVANSATFTEALAHTNTEMVEAERDQLKAEVERLKEVNQFLLTEQAHEEQTREFLRCEAETLKAQVSELINQRNQLLKEKPKICPNCKEEVAFWADHIHSLPNQETSYCCFSSQQLKAEVERLKGSDFCQLTKPGRGDCEHFIGLPGISIPGQHDGHDDTKDCYDKPNGWCWACWRSYENSRLRTLVASYEALNEEVGVEFEGVDEIKEVIRLLKQERDQLKTEVEREIWERKEKEKWRAVARELSMALGNDGVETNNDLSELARNNALASFNAMEKGQT